MPVFVNACPGLFCTTPRPALQLQPAQSQNPHRYCLAPVLHHALFLSIWGAYMVEGSRVHLLMCTHAPANLGSITRPISSLQNMYAVRIIWRTHLIATVLHGTALASNQGGMTSPITSLQNHVPRLQP